MCLWKNCPPTGARAQNIKDVFRLVRNDPIKFDDFTPYAILYPKNSNYQTCMGKATSCGDFNYIQKIHMLPRFKNHKIAIGKINFCDGKSMIDTRGHISWWITINSPQNQFRIKP